MTINKLKIKYIQFYFITMCITVVIFCFSFISKTNAAGWEMGAPPVGVPNDLDLSIMNITNWILGFIAGIAVLALIWGGVVYVTSAGNEQQAENAKKTMQYALMGVVIAGMAYAIINVIVSVILV